MKWIGQQIYDLASRFRSDVYLESISAGTIASGAHLGLDSNNKIVKAVDGGGDLTSIVAGTGLSGTSLTGPIPTLNVDAAQAGITSLGTLTALQVDNININGNTITSSTAADLTINVTDGQSVVIEGLDIDDGVVTGASSITSTAFVGDITGDVTGQADTVATIAGLAPNTATTQATQPAIESIGTDGDTLAVLADELLMSNTTADAPTIKLVNTTDDEQGSRLIFEKLRDDNGVASGQNIGEIWFRGQDAAQNTEDYAYIIGEIDVGTSGQESGQMKIGLANHDGGNGNAIIMTGGSENNEIDLTLGLGANSVITIPGDIDLAGDIDVDGTLETDALTIGGVTIAAIGTTAITTLGTIGTGVWNGTAIASANLDADTMHYSAQRQLTHHTIQDDIDTQVVFLSLAEFDGENTTIGNNKLPLIAPVAGKLLKVFVRCSHNLSGVDFTWKLYTRTSSQSTNGNAAEIGAQTGTGPTNGNMVTYDFTTGLDSGTNAVGAGDKVQISLETNGSTSNANFFITLMWEWDLS